LQIELEQARAETTEARKENEYLERQLNKFKEAEEDVNKNIKLVIEDRENIEKRMSERLIELRKSEIKNEKLEEEFAELKREF